MRLNGTVWLVEPAVAVTVRCMFREACLESAAIRTTHLHMIAPPCGSYVAWADFGSEGWPINLEPDSNGRRRYFPVALLRGEPDPYFTRWGAMHRVMGFPVGFAYCAHSGFAERQRLQTDPRSILGRRLPSVEYLRSGNVAAQKTRPRERDARRNTL